MSVKSLIISLLTLCVCIFAAKATDIRENVAFLAGPQTEGRATGSPGNQKAAFYIINSFKGSKLKKLSCTNSYVHSFEVPNKKFIGHNIVGMLDGNPYCHPEEYIVVGAHFDGLGTLLDQVYPCADANASGVALMLQLVKDLSSLIKKGRRFNYNIIFVAFDGYHEDISGAKAFMQSIKDADLIDPWYDDLISRSQIKLMVDLSQLGGCVPPKEAPRKEYLIALGQNSLTKDQRTFFHTANCMGDNSLDLYTDYYGSDRFTEAFYNMGDRKVFIKAGIPTLLFTSGISDLTYSKNDTAQSLDYKTLDIRYRYIFNFLFLCLHGI